MFLTFALFVGTAVVAIGLYVAFALHGQIQTAMRQSLVQQTERIAILVEQAGTSVERRQVVRDVARLTNLRITVVARDSVVWDARGLQLLSDGALQERPEMAVSAANPTHVVERRDADGKRMVYIAMYRPVSGLIVRIGQPWPPLFDVIRRTEATLIVGLVMALALALLGSWVAAIQVTRPLRSIRNSARAISEGPLEGKIRVDSRATEFQDLAKSLNRMSDGFREKIGELQRLAQLQNEFIGNVSHEVRNPIFAVGGYLEALGSPTLSEQQRKLYAEKGLVNLQRLNNLFNDLIEIARLEYREDLLRPSVFDLQELVSEVVDMLQPKAFEKGLTLETENPHLLVEADRNRLRQVIVNLLDNAIAYTDEGFVRLRFRRRLEKVRVEVVDTGRGIPEDHLDRVFERFHRVDPDRSRKSGGTGLGLSIVRQILQAHGEAIHVESTFGRGTRFWFEVPYKGEAGAALPPAAA